MIVSHRYTRYKKSKKQYDDCLSEIDFYPPADNRTLKSYIEDTDGDNFADYCEYIFDLYEDEYYYEN